MYTYLTGSAALAEAIKLKTPEDNFEHTPKKPERRMWISTLRRWPEWKLWKTAASSSGSNTSGTAANTTLDNDKRFLSHPILTGEEKPPVINEWWMKLLIKLERSIPTSEDYLKSAMNSQIEITTDTIEAGANKMIGHQLNKDIYALLTNTSTKKAWHHIKNVGSHQGLEAFRCSKKPL